MMSSLETSSPVSASTCVYLIRWPVFLLIWLKLIFSESDVAGYKATGQVTRERRKKPFQLARGAIRNSEYRDATEPGFKPMSADSFRLGRRDRTGRAAKPFRASKPSGIACAGKGRCNASP